jgi:hypothetical protein
MGIATEEWGANLQQHNHWTGDNLYGIAITKLLRAKRIYYQGVCSSSHP